MDSKKKQVIMLGTLAVLALGAGSYYIFGRGGDDLAARAQKMGPVVRKEAEVAKDDGKSARKKPTAAPETTKAVTQRKDAATETASGTQRKRSATEKTKVAKKQMSPAA